MFRELDTVVLARDLEGYPLKAGDVGAVVHCYADGEDLWSGICHRWRQNGCCRNPDWSRYTPNALWRDSPCSPPCPCV